MVGERRQPGSTIRLSPACVLVWGLLAGGLSFERSALAQPPAAAPAAGQSSASAGAHKRAMELFEQSVAAYRAGDFVRAASLVKQAYALSPAPVLLYNLARAQEGMGTLEDAIASYREYLQKEPTATDRGAIEKKIATLDAQLAERRRLQDENARRAAEAKAANERAESAPTKRSPVPWIVAGVGGAAMIGGGVLYFVAKDRHEAAQREPVQTRAEDFSQQAGTLGTAAIITLAVGGALAVTGAVLGLTSGGKSEPKTAAYRFSVVW